MNRKTFFKSLLGLCGLAAVGLPAAAEVPKPKLPAHYGLFPQTARWPGVKNIYDVVDKCGCLRARFYAYEDRYGRTEQLRKAIAYRLRFNSEYLQVTFPGHERTIAQACKAMQLCPEHYRNNGYMVQMRDIPPDINSPLYWLRWDKDVVADKIQPI